ncbi:MAG: gamma-glutamyl phosphate reductase [Symbiobacteriaceae bacterium]|jgi:glutamate-5-semialdehyde dehydrogenase|nr:gamma-glutamyl phosphate reductase [Symbiobacteriaceae bacterium]
MISVAEQARAARKAQRVLETASPELRRQALEAVAEVLAEREAELMAANAEDLAAAAHLPGPMVARLRLDARKLQAMREAVLTIAAMPDILGEELADWTRPNGIQIRRVRVPLGVVGIIYEARPNVTVDAAALCLRSGNAVLLKGGKEAARSNQALGAAIADGLRRAGLPGALVQVLPATRESTHELMNAVGLVDVLIPRGGAGLIQTVLRESRVPVIETGAGVCHIYVHAAADLAMASAVTVNAKCSAPAVCNAAETLLVDRAVAAQFLAQAGPALAAKGVALRACPEAAALLPGAELATEEDWSTEYNDLILSVKVVGGLEEALAHIAQYGTRHSEAIITKDEEAASRFLSSVDAAAVYHNASTRFTDGGEFGFGAEIGISTQKLHARGPMGLAELTSYKYVIRGNGQVR